MTHSAAYLTVASQSVMLSVKLASSLTSGEWSRAPARFHQSRCWIGGGMAARGARAAAGPDAADRRADGLSGERSGCAVLARSVPGCAPEAGMDGRQQSPDRTSLERQ